MFLVPTTPTLKPIYSPVKWVPVFPERFDADQAPTCGATVASVAAIRYFPIVPAQTSHEVTIYSVFM